MKKNIDGFSTVILGAWNARIFTPDWVSKNLTRTENIGVELPMANPNLAPRLRFDKIKLIVSHNSLITIPDDDFDETAITAYNVAISSLEKLEHTPVSGVGINFQYTSEGIDILKDIANFVDVDKISNRLNTISYTAISRGIIIDELFVNYSIRQEEFSAVIDINIHKDVLSAIEASEYLKKYNVIDLQKKFYEFLYDVYGLEID